MARRPKNKHLKAPKILEDIADLMEKWNGTEHEDFIEELKGWHNRATKALIELSLNDNEGVQILRQGIKELIADVNGLLMTKSPKDMPDVERAELMGYVRGIGHLETFFEAAEQDIREVQNDVDNQDTADESNVG